MANAHNHDSDAPTMVVGCACGTSDDSGEHRGTRYLSKHGNALLCCLLFNGALAAEAVRLPRF